LQFSNLFLGQRLWNFNLIQGYSSCHTGFYIPHCLIQETGHIRIGFVVFQTEIELFGGGGVFYADALGDGLQLVFDF
jgi:hypothetical protein